MIGPSRIDEEHFRFQVWAPHATEVTLHFEGVDDARRVPLQACPRGYYEAVVGGVKPGNKYRYFLDHSQALRPDPASRYQPLSVHQASQIIDDHFEWTDSEWRGIPLEEYVIYETHVGTFTAQGTFDAVVPELQRLRDLGITALELMPVAQFPGKRNWGYDGVYPFAVQESYGGPMGLKRLVDACHHQDLAVVLDVVYNHLGPEGNYLWDYGPYFTDRYRTPWGAAINFDGPGSQEVRRFFIDNARYWIREFHIDALRLDAVHAIFDFSATHFLEELAGAVRQEANKLRRFCYLFPESDLNDARLIRSPAIGGYGLDAQWSDDFHHAIHALLTGEQTGYYQDFGTLDHLTRALKTGYTYSGDYSVFRKRPHGNSPEHNEATQFIICVQNHDQVGNRMYGDRLSQNIPFDAVKMAAGLCLLSPYLPLIFMGEEYGETAPFQFFVDHSDQELNENIRKGRKNEFAQFCWTKEPPDPLAELTFLQSKIDSSLGEAGHHGVLYRFYQELLRIRKTLPAFVHPSKKRQEIWSDSGNQTVFIRRWHRTDEAYLLFNLNRNSVETKWDRPSGEYQRILCSSDALWSEVALTEISAMHTQTQVFSTGECFSLKPYSFMVWARSGQ